MYAESLITTWIVMCALSRVATLGSTFTRKVNMDGELNSEHRLRAGKTEGNEEVNLEQSVNNGMGLE